MTQPAQKREHVIKFRANDAEYATLSEYAKAYGVSLAELVRRSALRIKIATPVRAENMAQVRDLARLASNVNALVRQSYIIGKRLDSDDREGSVRAGVGEELTSLLASANQNMIELLTVMKDMRDLLVDDWDATRSEALEASGRGDQA